MGQSATLPTYEHPTEEKDALQATAPLLTQSLEDHRLAERVERALRATGYGALRTVRVSVNARVVILGGRVSQLLPETNRAGDGPGCSGSASDPQRAGRGQTKLRSLEGSGPTHHSLPELLSSA